MEDKDIKRYPALIINKSGHYLMTATAQPMCMSADVTAALKEAQEEIERLKCCGNCKFHEYCTEDIHSPAGVRCCDNWEAKK